MSHGGVEKRCRVAHASRTATRGGARIYLEQDYHLDWSRWRSPVLIRGDSLDRIRGLGVIYQDVVPTGDTRLMGGA